MFSSSSLLKERFKWCKKKPPPPHTSLSKAKSLLFPEKQTSYNRREKEKNHPAFCVFLTNGSCLSHCLPHSHPHTLRAVALSKSTTKYHEGQPNIPHYPSLHFIPHTPCPPGCVSSGLCGINELIHTVLRSSIPLVPSPNVNKPKVGVCLDQNHRLTADPSVNDIWKVILYSFKLLAFKVYFRVPEKQLTAFSGLHLNFD